MPERPATIELHPCSSGGIHILLADDYEPWRSRVRSFLERQTKYKISEACDGLDAVRKAVELRPDVVLLDISMPGLNGIQAAIKIRELSPDSRIIFLSQERHEDIVATLLLKQARGRMCSRVRW